MSIKKLVILISIGLLLLLSFLFFSRKNPPREEDLSPIQEEIKDENQKNELPLEKVEEEKGTSYLAPLENPEQRIAKKSFSDFITPQNSPVQPERFSGFHTGVDFEIFPEELNSDVEVKAVCSGKTRLKTVANGYGGILVQDCVLENNPATIIYGHLKFDSIGKKIGEILEEGEILGILGKNQSPETDGERKHLHLAIHRGFEISLLGYVKNQSDLENWIDPCLYFCQ